MTKPSSWMEQQPSPAHNADNYNLPKSGRSIIMSIYWEQTVQHGTSSPMQSISISQYEFLTISSSMKNIFLSRLSGSSEILCASSSTTEKNWNSNPSSLWHGTWTKTSWHIFYSSKRSKINYSNVRFHVPTQLCSSKQFRKWRLATTSNYMILSNWRRSTNEIKPLQSSKYFSRRSTTRDK